MTAGDGGGGRGSPNIAFVALRAWLHELSLRAGEKLYLQDLPLSVLLDLRERGVDTIVLSDVFDSGAHAADLAHNDKLIRDNHLLTLPDYDEEDALTSPYVVYRYVANSLSARRADDETVDTVPFPDPVLEEFHERAKKLGLRVVLPFTAAFAAYDSPLKVSRPGLFYWSTDAAQLAPGIAPDDSYYARYRNFTEMPDASQINVFGPEAMAHAIDTMDGLLTISDGIWCNFADLALEVNHLAIFYDLYGYGDPRRAGDLDNGAFWRAALHRLRRLHPDAVFYASSRGGQEDFDTLLACGFDYVYIESERQTFRWEDPTAPEADGGPREAAEGRKAGAFPSSSLAPPPPTGNPHTPSRDPDDPDPPPEPWPEPPFTPIASVYEILGDGNLSGPAMNEFLRAPGNLNSLRRSVTYLEDHFTPRAANHLGFRNMGHEHKHLSALVLAYTLPGARSYFVPGQFEGLIWRLAYDLRRPYLTLPRGFLEVLYKGLRGLLSSPLLSSGEWDFVSLAADEPPEGPAGDPGRESSELDNAVSYSWAADGKGLFFLFNLGDKDLRARAMVPPPDPLGESVVFREVLIGEALELPVAELMASGLPVEVPSWQYRAYQYQ